jgi:hypothetical protein
MVFHKYFTNGNMIQCQFHCFHHFSAARACKYGSYTGIDKLPYFSTIPTHKYQDNTLPEFIRYFGRE